jgi:deazaflavin-dependent oxidoreductase (nitroreductase family)
VWYGSCMHNDLVPTAGSAPIDERIRATLAHGQVIDITTTGRHSGAPRRIEIVFHNIGGRIFITGMPRRETRAWLHNLRADPRLTLHLKGTAKADLPATAREITDEAERRQVFDWVVANAWPQNDPVAMARFSPLVEVDVEGLAA